ncbi:hypothetical protein [Antarcticirhabdus aurantiaca]|uniref:Uncharacterized protein n=1 Tax=Antarcticirhabdus aurantiaca TaxID=2606717 RepID=A0ACD4NK51_9HYPH|nr:hypothetical protein [Antarcticirhabdus aurantiaca]WAJ27131.1 hypothetical protein OXU80_20075 [Jeongeuplla avenae]
MADLRPFLLMDKLQAARFREETAGDENRLDPVLVRGGPHTGKYVLPERVIYDDAFEARRDAFRMLTVVSLDVTEAFPPEPEPDEDA